MSSTNTQKNKKISPQRKKIFQKALLFSGTFFIVGLVFLGTTHTAHGLGEGLGEDIAKAILNAILAVEMWLVGGAAVLFSWVLEPTFFYNIMQNVTLYTWWQMVRDVFNLFFISALLLTAFSTIFQVSRFHYSKTLIDIIIMAFFVNFSFPISRFIIDFFNRMMYFLLNLSGIEGGNDLLTVFLTNSGLINALTPKDATVSTLLFAVIFAFIFAIALLVLSILFAVRIVVLLLLVIFSPLGFAGRIMPGVEKYASQWWGWLFQYATFGPFAMLMLVISLSMMKTINMDTTIGSRLTTLTNGVAARYASSNTIESMVYLIIPVILMFYTIGIGKKMSIAFADVAGKAAKVATGAGIFLSTYGLSRAAKSWNASRKDAREDAAARYKQSFIGRRIDPAGWGRGASKKQDDLVKKYGTDGASIDARKRALAADRKKFDGEVDRYDKAGLSTAELETRMRKGDKAAAGLLGKRGSIKDSKTFEEALKVAEGHYGATSMLLSGVQKSALSNPEIFKKALEAMNKGNMNPESAEKLVGKISRGTFKNDTATDLETAKNVYIETLKTEAFVNNPDLQKEFEKKLKESGALQVIIEGGSKPAEEILAKVKMEDFNSQSKTFYNDANVEKFVEDRAANNPQYIGEGFKSAVRGGNADAVEFWESIRARRGGGGGPKIVTPGSPDFKKP